MECIAVKFESPENGIFAVCTNVCKVEIVLQTLVQKNVHVLKIKIGHLFKLAFFNFF